MLLTVCPLQRTEHSKCTETLQPVVKPIFDWFCFYIHLSFWLGDIARIPEMLANSMIEGAGVDSDVADEDEEMSSNVKKGKHRRINPSY